MSGRTGPKSHERELSFVLSAWNTLSFADLVAACHAFRHNDIIPLLRQRYLPIHRAGEQPAAVITDQRSFEAAQRAGHTVAARVRNKDLALALQQVFGTALIERASTRLFRLHPAFSARNGLSARLAVWLLTAAVSMGVLHFAFSAIAGRLLGVILSLMFLGGIALRLLAVINLAHVRERPRRPLNDAELPVYTVLVPLFRESRVLEQLLQALGRLDYPRDKLDIKIILEEEDGAMKRQVGRLNLPAPFEILIVPKGSPQTKPRALCYGLYFARGELVTVFDAEDVPEPGQLRHAAEIFAAAPATLACLQARLTFHDANQKWLSRQSAIEYAALFDVVLPVLGLNRWPIPLGGTSNHFRADVLRKVGGWDPFNVTEDADLGLRLSRCGFEIDVFNSTTFEEANTSLPSWMRQRCRWIKGWMQTGLVHLRSPRVLLADLGAQRFCITLLLLVGMVVSPLMHPFLMAFTLWSAICGVLPGKPDIVAATLTGLGAVIFTGGYAAALATQLAGIKARGLKGFAASTASTPIYWLMISAAAWMAVWELVRRPHYWHKTEHGLSSFSADAEKSGAGDGDRTHDIKLGKLAFYH